MKKIKNQILNSRFFTSFRKSFLKKILSDIESGKAEFCCFIYSNYSSYICWKDLKEVKENMDSIYLRQDVVYNCKEVWFNCKSNRINFLKECLKKFEK